VAGGATTPAQIASLMGMDTSSLTYHLNVMRHGGFLRHDQDLLLQRRPVITVADPVVKFHNLVIRPNLLDFEMRKLCLDGRPDLPPRDRATPAQDGGSRPRHI
jgi:uncharacterized protein